MEAIINIVGNWLMPVLGDLNDRAISLEEVGEAVNEINLVRHRGWMDFQWNV